MLACFGCGRSGRFDPLEPSSAPPSAHKCPSSEERNYFNEMNKDPCIRIAEVKTHLNMGSFSRSMDMDFSAEDKAFIDAVPIHAPLAKEEDFAHPPKQQFDGYREEKKQLVVSAVVVKHGTIRDGCSAEEGKDEHNITEDISSMTTPMKEIVSSKREKEKDLLSPGVKGKELDRNEAAKDKLHRKLVSGTADGEELLKKAISEEGTTCVMHRVRDANNHQNVESDYDDINMSGEPSSTQDGEKKQGTINAAHEDYKGCNDKGVISQRKLEPKALFSYGISDQQRDFLFLCAGLVIQAVGFQLRSIVEVATALILLCYRTYIFACRFADMLLRAKQKLVEMRTLLFSQAAIDGTRIALNRERWESMKPLLIRGAKKMGWGCLNAAYVLAVLSGLLLTSFLFSYIAVKGGATQKPIHITKELYFDYTKAQPVASLDLFSLDAYSRMRNASNVIKASQGPSIRYRCTILLTLPESDHNRKLGIFQVTSELLSEKGEVVEKGSQPSMLVFKSNTVYKVKAIVMAIPLLTGLASETQTVRLQLLEWHHNASARLLQIVLVPRAGRTGLPQLYKAHILVDSLHSPFLPSSSFSMFRTLSIWLLLSFLIFGCLSSFCMYTMHH